MLLQELLELELKKPMEKNDVMKLATRKGLKYMYYDDIKPSNTLKQLLPSPGSGLLILFVKHDASKVGHFCLLFKHPRSGLHFFDSYGFGLRKVLDITGSTHKLENLLKGTDVHINKIPYQQLEKGHEAVNTCGRHCITRWNCAQFKPKEYEDLMHHPSMDADTIVTMLTLESDLSKLSLKGL